MLRFKSKFLDAIRSGEKTQTLRCWKTNRLKAGRRDYIPGVGSIQITAADEVQMEDLTDADAIPDGFPTLAALQQELADIYGEPLPGKLFRIRFRLLETEEKLESEEEKAETTNETLERADGSAPNLRLHKIKQETKENLTAEEVAKKLLVRCRIHRNSCDWNHEPGKSLDFFALFLRSPRDSAGVPALDGYLLQGLARQQCSPEEWEEIGWLVSDVCRSWTEWQYAIERWCRPLEENP